MLEEKLLLLKGGASILSHKCGPKLELGTER